MKLHGKCRTSIRGYLTLLACVVFQLVPGDIAAYGKETGTHVIKSKDIAIRVSDTGEITAVSFGAAIAERAVSGLTNLEGCVVETVKANALADGGMEFTKTLLHEEGKHALTLVERFLPTASSIRWEIEMRDSGEAWTTPIETRLQYPVTEGTGFWTAWADPRHAIAGRMNREQLIAAGIVPDVNESGNWADPLVPVRVGSALFWYGAEPYRDDLITIAPHSRQGRQVFCVPLATLIDVDTGIGLSLVLSPEDLLLDMSLTTTEEGQITFSRLYHRLGQGRPVRFAMDLVAHEADWRPALHWMTQRYSQFFDPPNPRARHIAGTGAYSSHDADFDAEKMKAMAFMANWKASFDFPYMGMFLPPVDGADVPWQRFGGDTITIGQMRQYSRKMREMGFHVLSYFNVTEFGAKVKFPAPERKTESDAELWKNCNDFLYAKLADAVVLSDYEKKERKGFYQGDDRGLKPYWTWGHAVVMDPGEPVYQDFLLGQAQRHIRELPDASGFCIDRLDWLRLYNHQRDDGVSWFDNQAVRSLNCSWRELMSKLGPMVHEADKVVYCNNHTKRIEHLRHIDGIFDEFTYSGLALNTTSLLGVRKPVLGWTRNEEQLKPDPDAFFQKYLYLGVFPMCPFPGNDHSLRPSEWVDKQYIDYGPLMTAMRGRKWVLEPYAVSVPQGNAKANIFEVPVGFVVPVVYAGDAGNVRVVLRNKKVVNETLPVYAIHPGTDQPAVVRTSKGADSLTLDVPVKRGCAMVTLFTDSPQAVDSVLYNPFGEYERANSNSKVNMHLLPKGEYEIGSDQWGKIVRVNMLKIRAWSNVPGVKKAWIKKSFEGVEGMAFHPVISDVKDVDADGKSDIFRCRSEHEDARIERLGHDDGRVVWVSEPMAALHGD